MKQKTRKNRTKLISQCPDAAQCMMFGIKTKQIKDVFRFDFNLVTSIKNIAEPSSNGFVHELKFDNNYIMYATLKSNVASRKDNLMYEYKVGQFLNQVGKVFPCFIETYKVFKYKSEDDWYMFSKIKSSNDTSILHALQPLSYDLKKGCKYAKHIALLTQYIPNSISLYDFCENNPDYNELLGILFQIYYSLYHLRKHFTHYDLHAANVLLYKIHPTQSIKFNYTVSGKIVSFCCSYLVKIIDYGRCYIPDAKHIYNKVCHLSECAPKCGSKKGFSTFDLINDDIFYHIVSQKKNESFDLKCLKYCSDVCYDYPETHPIQRKLANLNILYSKHGTPERLDSIQPFRITNEIRNLTDAYQVIQELIPYSKVCSSNWGALNVYGNKPSTFIKFS
jgi:hypothetical protein